MVRSGCIAIAALLVACSGEIQSDIYDNLPPTQQVSLEKWVDKALPVFSKKCVMCHDGSMGAEIAYLAGATDLEKRDTLVAHVPAVVNLGAPQSSRVLTKGVHTGPALDAKEASDILSWIVAERDSRKDLPVIRSMPVVPTICTAGMTPCPTNTIDLSSLGVPATLTFEASQLVSDLYLTNIKVAPGAMGVHFSHPIFESTPAGAMAPKPDSIDRWFNVDLNLAPNAAAVTLGTGEGSFVGFGAADPLTVRFDVYEAQKAM